MSVVLLADVKKHLNIPASVTTDDAELQVFIDAAEAAIGERVGPLSVVSRTIRRSPTYRHIRVPSPADALVSVVDDAGTAVTVGDLRLDKDAGLIYYADGSVFASEWYDVTYSHGHNPCPADLILAVKELVRHLWDTQRGRSTPGGPRASETVANTVPGAAFVFPFRVSQLLSPHMPQLVG